MSGADPYLYPNSNVLINRLGIRDAVRLEALEREFVTQRAAEDPPGGNFDLIHLRAIHKHLFQDIYSWAGEIRTVEIAKDGHAFQFRKFVETGMADVHRRLERTGFLEGLDGAKFAEAAGQIIGDINYVHPFREGNGRTQLQYLKQLASRAGHAIDLTRIEPMSWLEASIASHGGDYTGMIRAIRRSIPR